MRIESGCFTGIGSLPVGQIQLPRGQLKDEFGETAPPDTSGDRDIVDLDHPQRWAKRRLKIIIASGRRAFSRESSEGQPDHERGWTRLESLDCQD